MRILTPSIASTFASFLLLATSASAQPSARLLPAAPGDLVATEVVSQPLPRDMEVPQQPVALDWAVETDFVLQRAEPHVARSKEYWVDVTASRLREGIPLQAGPGSLVRVNPAPGIEKGSAPPLALDALRIETRNGSLDAADAADLLVDDDQLGRAGVPFPQGTVALRLREDLTGPLSLRAVGLAPTDAPYVVHVLDRASTATLELGAHRDTYLDGQILVLDARLTGTDEKVAVSAVSVDGFVLSPQGRTMPLKFKTLANGTLRARLKLEADTVASPAPWEAHVMLRGTENGRALQRFAKTAFGVAAPTARLLGEAALEQENGRVAVTLAVEAGSPGRYEVRGILYGTSEQGSPVPIGIAHSATSMSPGSSDVRLSWSVGETSGPYEVRDLRLLDQTRMSLLHRQARGLALAP